MSFSSAQDKSTRPQITSTDTRTITKKYQDAFNETYSYVYSPSTTTTTNAADAKGNTQMLIVAAVAGLLMLLGIVAARS